MITLKFETVNSKAFVDAIVNLSKSHEVDAQTAYRAGVIFQNISAAMRKSQEEEGKIYEKYVKREGDGKVVEEAGNPVFVEGGLEKADEEVKKFREAMEIKIKVHRLNFAALKGLSGQELVAIAEISDNVPEVP